MKIVYTRKALRQIDQIYSYIEAHNATAALRAKTRIQRAIDRLARHPYSARSSDAPACEC